MSGVSFFPGGTVNTSSSSRSSAGAKSKKPCKYGPRDEDGYCPKKPKAAKSAKKKAPCKYGPRDEDGYCPKKPSKYSSKAAPEKKLTKKQSSDVRKLSSAAGKVAGDAAGAVVGEVIKNRQVIKEVAKNVAKAPVGTVVKAAVGGSALAGGLLTGIALAGVASYMLTSYIINRAPKKRAELNEAASQAGMAYAAARKEAVKMQKGKPLTAAQNKILGDAFKAELKAIGVQWPLRQ